MWSRTFSKCPVFFLGYFQTFMSATHNTRRGMAVAGKGQALPAKGGGSLWRHLMMCVWLGHLHVAVAVFALAVYKLPHPLAVAVLAAYVTATLAPNRPPYPRWGIAIARAITNAAMGYFPCTMEWEDEPGYLAAAARGRPHVLGLEPHSVLPLSIVSFGKYFFYTPTTPECVRNSRALATETIFVIPFMRQLWSWLGMDPISKRRMRRLLDAGRTVLLIPGGVAECLEMRHGVETIYLRRRFGFVKLAIQTGAGLIPAFTFGQRDTYNYWRLGPPLCPPSVAAAIARVIKMAPMFFWGKWGTFLPQQVPMHTVIGKALEVTKNENPTNEEVEAKLKEFIDAMEGIFERHKERHGYGDTRLVVL